MTRQQWWILGGVAVALLWGPQIARALARRSGEVVGEAGAGVVIDAATGAVIGVGKAVGVPETNLSKCEQDIAAGDLWAASFDCPASTYLQAAWNSTFGK